MRCSFFLALHSLVWAEDVKGKGFPANHPEISFDDPVFHDLYEKYKDHSFLLEEGHGCYHCGKCNILKNSFTQNYVGKNIYLTELRENMDERDNDKYPLFGKIDTKRVHN